MHLLSVKINSSSPGRQGFSLQPWPPPPEPTSSQQPAASSQQTADRPDSEQPSLRREPHDATVRLDTILYCTVLYCTVLYVLHRRRHGFLPPSPQSLRTQTARIMDGCVKSFHLDSYLRSEVALTSLDSFRPVRRLDLSSYGTTVFPFDS
jgi:hypothetical protein